MNSALLSYLLRLIMLILSQFGFLSVESCFWSSVNYHFSFGASEFLGTLVVIYPCNNSD
jgi:hypothetical protein